MLAAIIAAVVGGLVIGSFLNVVIWRLPRGESLAKPASRCPSCGTPIKPYDNIPVLSWLLLRGRCRNCGAKVSARYPLVEALTAGLYAAVVAAKWDDTSEIALGIAMVTFLVPIAFIDLDTRKIPNKLTAPAAVVALGLGLGLDIDFVPEMLISAAGGFLFFFLAAVMYPKGMGMGDVKLAGVMGLYLGRAVAPAIFAGLILGVVVGAVIIARKGAQEGRKTAVPFGPFLAAGAILGLFVGEDIMDEYLDRY